MINKESLDGSGLMFLPYLFDMESICKKGYMTLFIPCFYLVKVLMDTLYSTLYIYHYTNHILSSQIVITIVTVVT